MDKVIYKDDDLVTIISGNHSHASSIMKKMIGKTYKITYVSHRSCIINHYVWSMQDIRKFIKPKEFKPEIFKISNLVEKGFKYG